MERALLRFHGRATVYARALTGPEIAAIAAAGSNGKAVYSLPPAQSLAALNVSVDGASLGVNYGDNAQWNTYSVEFTALDTNAVLVLQSLVPGTLVDGITLTEVASELSYLPEVPLADLYGQNTYGVWTLEIMNDYTDVTATNAQLVEWQLNFGLAPSNPPPVISLSHGITYTNSIVPDSIQVLHRSGAAVGNPGDQRAIIRRPGGHYQFSARYSALNQTNYPSPADPALIGPLVSSGTTVLATNTTPTGDAPDFTIWPSPILTPWRLPSPWGFGACWSKEGYS